MIEVIEENPKDDDLWVEAFQAKFEGKGKKWGRKEWDALLGHCMVSLRQTFISRELIPKEAVTDMPVICFCEDLIDAYPDAKVILTVRDSEDVWYQSVADTIWTGYYLLGFPKSTLQLLIQNIAPRPEAWRTMRYSYEYGIKNFPTSGKQIYLEHNAKIRSLVPKERLLEFNVKQGWGPLCEFLGVPVPDIPFPRVNDTKAWLAEVGRMKMKAAMNIVKVLAILGVVVVGVYLRWTNWGQ